MSQILFTNFDLQQSVKTFYISQKRRELYTTKIIYFNFSRFNITYVKEVTQLKMSTTS